MHARIATTISVLLSITTASACRTLSPPVLKQYDPPAAIRRDFVIAPAVRVGPVKLGMTVRELHEAVGKEYNATDFPTGSSRLWYQSLELYVYVNDDRVYKIEPTTARYATQDGIHLWSSKSDLVASFGQPEWSKTVHRGERTWEVDCYPGDTEFQLGVLGNQQIFAIALGACDDGDP
jgi:hypothetical protein